jgi:hypothetical protein
MWSAQWAGPCQKSLNSCLGFCKTKDVFWFGFSNSVKSWPERVEEDAAGDEDEDGLYQGEEAGHHQQVPHCITSCQSSFHQPQTKNNRAVILFRLLLQGGKRFSNIKGTVQRDCNYVFLPTWLGLGLNLSRSWFSHFSKAPPTLDCTSNF